MNERIKELALQAGASYYNTYTGPLLSPKDIEKFAELIVRECSLFVFKQNGPKSALNLLGHFGVEE
jgi:hypothetical protein